MHANFREQASTGPTSYIVRLPGPGPTAEREQTSSPAPSFGEPDHSPDHADAGPISTDDDGRWDVFLPDDDEIDPLPEPGDFWVDGD